MANYKKHPDGVLVKFNCVTNIHLIPDDQYEQELATMKDIRRSNFKNYQERLASGSPFEYRTFNIGEEAYIPEWYYKAHKNDVAEIPIAIDRIKDKNGYRRPFRDDEAITAIDCTEEESHKTTKMVKRFERIKGVQEDDQAA